MEFFDDPNGNVNGERQAERNRLDLRTKRREEKALKIREKVIQMKIIRNVKNIEEMELAFSLHELNQHFDQIEVPAAIPNFVYDAVPDYYLGEHPQLQRYPNDYLSDSE